MEIVLDLIRKNYARLSKSFLLLYLIISNTGAVYDLGWSSYNIIHLIKISYQVACDFVPGLLDPCDPKSLKEKGLRFKFLQGYAFV
jgi:hypothetical protein